MRHDGKYKFNGWANKVKQEKSEDVEEAEEEEEEEGKSEETLRLSKSDHYSVNSEYAASCRSNQILYIYEIVLPYTLYFR